MQILRRPTAHQAGRHISSAGAPRGGWFALAGSPPAPASPATASGTRTSIPTMRSTPNRDPPASRHAPGETSAGRHVTLGNCDKARKARLRGEQVVTVGVKTAVGDTEPDRK